MEDVCFISINIVYDGFDKFDFFYYFKEMEKKL